ncbi:MAG: hypothetical protein QOD75_1740 [Blastocatellia bacterium]|nr:hypothetical protein [Blastocatellia bacterium]
MILETMKLNNTAEIEKYKACLDLRREEVKELRTVYSTVAQKLRQFEKDFDNCLTTCEDASDTRKKKRQSPRDAYDALIAAAKGLAEIQALARDTRVSADLRSSLLDMNERVIRNISATLDNDRQLAKIDKLPEFVASGRTDLQPKIVQIKVQMETATKSLKAESCNSN